MGLKVSVAMAVYNGEAYLEEQLASVLSQLREEDEVIISLDPSKDGTERLLREYHKKDSRIRVCRGPGTGVVKNFENAIRHCKNDIIFLADQDDVWVDGKVQRILDAFENDKVVCVLHDAYVVDKELNILETSFFALRGCRKGVLKNIFKNSYIGCCMAFRRNCVKKCLPFPDKIPMHDQWLGINCELLGEVCFVREPLLKYRRHEHNVSEMKHASFIQMIIWRKRLIQNLIKRIGNL